MSQEEIETRIEGNSSTSTASNADVVTFVSDIEGNWDYWNRFLAISTCFSIENPETKERKIILNKGYTFVYGGDVCDKGPGDIRILKDLLQIKKDHEGRVHFLMGIRDTNKLRLHFELHESQMFQSYKHFEDGQLPPCPTCPKISKDDPKHEKLLSKYRIERLKWILSESMSTPTLFNHRREELFLTCEEREKERKEEEEMKDNLTSELPPQPPPSPLERRELSTSQAALSSSTSETSPRQRQKKTAEQEVLQSFLDLYDPKCPDRCYGLQYLQQAKIGVVINNSLFIHGGLNTQALRFLPSDSAEQSALNDPQDGSSVDGSYCSDSIKGWIDKLNDWAQKEIENYIEALSKDSDYDFYSELWIRRRCYAHPQPGSGLLMYGAYHEGRRTQPNPSIFLTFDPLPHGKCQLDDAVLIAMEQDGLKNLVIGACPFGDVPIVTPQINSNPAHPISVVFADTNYSNNVTVFEFINGTVEKKQIAKSGTLKSQFLEAIHSSPFPSFSGNYEQIQKDFENLPDKLTDTRGFSADEVIIHPDGCVHLRGLYRDISGVHTYDQLISSTSFESQVAVLPQSEVVVLPISQKLSGKLIRPKLKVDGGFFLCSFTHGRSASNVLVPESFFVGDSNCQSETQLSLMEIVQSNNIRRYHRDYQQQHPDTVISDTMKLTPLMVAAECGHFPFVIYLIRLGATFMKGKYEHTAIHLAIERGHQDIAIFLLQQYKKEVCDTFNIVNKYDKNPLFSACEFGKLKVVEWILQYYSRYTNDSLYEYVNKPNNRGNTCLMLACAGQLNDDRDKIFDALLRAGADPSYSNQTNSETVLHWAARQGHVKFLQKMLSIPELEIGTLSLASTMDNKTVLESAIQQGSTEAVRSILTRLPLSHWAPDVQESSFRLAWEQGFVDIATDFFMNNQIFSEFNIKKEAFLSLKKENFQELFQTIRDEKEEKKYKKDLFQTVVNRLVGTGLETLSTYAGNSQFHFYFLLLCILPVAPSPNAALNKIFPNFIKSMRNCDVKHQINIVSNLIDLAICILNLIDTHPLEKSDLNQHFLKTLSMIKEVMTCDSLEDLNNMKSILQLSKVGYLDPTVELAQLIREGPVSKCIKLNISTIFYSTKLNQIVDELFYSSISRLSKILYQSSMDTPDTFYRNSFLQGLKFCVSLKFTSELTPTLSLSKSVQKLSVNLYNFTSPMIFIRYSPWLMFICEGLSKLGFLTIVAIVSVHRYSSDIKDVRDRPIEYHSAYTLLVIYFVSMSLYEWGQMTSRCNTLFPSFYTLKKYFKEDWNIFDFTSLVLILIGLCATESSPRSYGLLAASMPFITLSLMRYLSFIPSLGIIVLLLLEMTKDLFSFLVIYIFCAMGFCMALWALLSDQIYNQTFSDNFLYLFQVAMGGVSFFDFSGNPYSAVGVGLVFIFLLLSCVVILNLIIAQMSATYDRIMAESEQKFRLERAQTTRTFLLLTEKNPLCMLPAPLNLIPSLFMIVYFCLNLLFTNILGMFVSFISSGDLDSYFIRCCGILSDLLIGIPVCFIAPWYELFQFQYRVLNLELYQTQLINSRRTSERLPYFYFYLLINAIIFIIFLILYPCYVSCLFFQLGQSNIPLLFSFGDNEKTTVLNENKQFEVFYPKTSSFVPPPLPTKVEPYVSVKFLRGEVDPPASFQNPNPTIVVSLRFHGYEIFSPEPILSGLKPLWKGDAIVNFPFYILKYPKFQKNEKTIQVHLYELNVLTGEKTHIGTDDESFYGEIQKSELINDMRVEGGVSIVNHPFVGETDGTPQSKLNVFFAITVNEPSSNYDTDFGAKRYFSEGDLDKIFGQERSSSKANE